MRQGSDKHKNTKGDVMIRVLWEYQVNVIISVRLLDADADTYNYKHKSMTSLLSRSENINKVKHGKHYNNQRKHFSPFVISMDKILEIEFIVGISQLSQVM